MVGRVRSRSAEIRTTPRRLYALVTASHELNELETVGEIYASREAKDSGRVPSSQ